MRFHPGFYGSAGFALLSLISVIDAADWPWWRGPLRTGAAADSPPLIEALPDEGLQPLWTSEPIRSAREGGWASPAIANGRVFLFSHEREQLRELGPAKYPYLADDKRGRMTEEQFAEYEKNRREEGIERAKAYAFREHVYCLDAATGQTIWHTQSDSVYTRWPQSGSPTVVGDRLYILGAGLNLRCIDTATGDDIWVRRLPGEFVDEFFQSSVVVTDGAAIVLAGHLFAVNAETGSILWEGDRQKSAGNHSTPVVWESAEGPRIVANLNNGWTGGFDTRDGRELWRVKSEAGQSTPIVVGDRLITYGNSRQKGLRCFRMTDTTAEELWQYHGTQDKGSSPVVIDGHVYVQGERRVACVNLENGEAVWTGALDLASPQYTSLIAADGKVFYAYDGLTVFRASPESFTPLVQARFNSSNLMATDATLRRLLNLDEVEQQPDGREQAQKILNREVDRHGPLKCGTPAIAEGRLFLRMNSAVVCYDLRQSAPTP
jgi:outer membrane protein assembly factor BamB